MKRKLQQITCQLCGETHPSNGIHVHLKYKHDGMTTKQYIEKFGDFRTNTKIAEKLKDGKPLYKCLICGDDKTYTTTALSFHLIKQHNTDKVSYITTNILNGNIPTCKCGCGTPMEIKSYGPPHTTEYVSGHNKSTLGYKFSAESKKLMSGAATNKINLAKQTGQILPWHSPNALKKRGATAHKKSMSEKSNRHCVDILTENSGKIEFKCKLCGSEYAQYHTAYFTCLKCHPPKKSMRQLELYEFVKDELKISDAVMDHRKTFNGSMEIDIFIPSKNIGIEFDGLYYHAENNGNKDKNYHIWKTNECASRGIRLIHIFEDEWRDTPDIVKSKIQRLLGIRTTRVFARKCIVKEIDKNVAFPFINANHIQGAVPSTVYLGLYYLDELISVATFGKPTAARGRKIMADGEWELIRFCGKLDTEVIGAAGKLVSYFIKHNSPTKIISYADKRFTSSASNVYDKLGFKLISESPPNYFYMNDYANRLHRFNFIKSKLVAAGADPTKTEWQIMQEMGYDRIWDCGHLKYELAVK